MRTVLFNPIPIIFFVSFLGLSMNAGAHENQAITRTPRAPSTEVVKFKVGEMETHARLVQPVRSVSVQPDTVSSTDGDESRHSTYGTFAATLVLMIAIAIRRNRSGRS